MIKRFAEDVLNTWFLKKNRKPLVIRGARQVGKSTLVRQFAKNGGHTLVEINLEKYPGMETVFKRLDVSEIISEIFLITGAKLPPSGDYILFLDEIQATPSAIPALRYLYEEKPELPVIAAGSLLEFSLKSHNYSMPVGRIEYLYLGPVSFLEFCETANLGHLVEYLRNVTWEDTFSEGAHAQLCKVLREYIIAGGMPEASAIFLDTGDIRQAQQVHHSILDTYRNDFNKYASGTVLQKIQRVFDYVPVAVGEKFKYSNVNPAWQARDIRSAVDLLEQAGVLFNVHCTSGAGIPLNAHADNRVFKPFFLDVGLMATASGIKNLTLEQIQSTRFINEGKLAEQFIAQHLRFESELYIRPELHYWLREKQKKNAEIDFLIQIGDSQLPVEVKAGKSGSLKSLHYFCAHYKVQKALRFDLNKPALLNNHHKIMMGKEMGEVVYSLAGLPLYMVEESRRLAALIMNM